MTTAGLIVLLAYVVVPVALGFALPTRLLPLLAVGVLLALANWAWHVFVRPVDADMTLVARAVLGLIATAGLVAGCSGLALGGATARRRLARHAAR